MANCTQILKINIQAPQCGENPQGVYLRWLNSLGTWDGCFFITGYQDLENTPETKLEPKTPLLFIQANLVNQSQDSTNQLIYRIWNLEKYTGIFYCRGR